MGRGHLCPSPCNSPVRKQPRVVYFLALLDRHDRVPGRIPLLRLLLCRQCMRWQLPRTAGRVFSSTSCSTFAHATHLVFGSVHAVGSRDCVLTALAPGAVAARFLEAGACVPLRHECPNFTRVPKARARTGGLHTRCEGEEHDDTAHSEECKTPFGA